MVGVHWTEKKVRKYKYFSINDNDFKETAFQAALAFRDQKYLAIGNENGKRPRVSNEVKTQLDKVAKERKNKKQKLSLSNPTKTLP